MCPFSKLFGSSYSFAFCTNFTINLSIGDNNWDFIDSVDEFKSSNMESYNPQETYISLRLLRSYLVISLGVCSFQPLDPAHILLSVYLDISFLDAIVSTTLKFSDLQLFISSL